MTCWYAVAVRRLSQSATARESPGAVIRSGASRSGASRSGASLSGASLSGASLNNASLNNARLSRAVTLSCDTMAAGTPCSPAHAPVQRSVVRSDTSSASGRSRASSPASRRLRHSTRYPPVNGTRGARSVITRPCAVCRSLSRSPGMISTGSCPAAR